MECSKCGSKHIYLNTRTAVLKESYFILERPLCLDCGYNLPESYKMAPIKVEKNGSTQPGN